MDALPIRPQPAAHRPHRPAHRAAAAGPAPPAHAVHHSHGEAPQANAPAAAAAPASAAAEDRVVRAQRGFDEAAALLAEQAREANALRAMMMAQLKHDDQTMNDWIKMI